MRTETHFKIDGNKITFTYVTPTGSIVTRHRDLWDFFDTLHHHIGDNAKLTKADILKGATKARPFVCPCSVLHSDPQMGISVYDCIESNIDDRPEACRDGCINHASSNRTAKRYPALPSAEYRAAGITLREIETDSIPRRKLRLLKKTRIPRRKPCSTP